MSKIRKIIIALCIILLIIVISLIGIWTIIKNNYESGKQEITENEGIQAYEKEINKNLELVNNRTDFYTIEECVRKYYSYYSILYNIETYYYTDEQEVISQAEKDNSQILYNMLNSQYIEEKGITVNNLKSNLKEIKKVTVNITNMYVSHKTDNIDIYVIEGKLKSSIQEYGEKFKIILMVDLINKTFSIMPQEYVVEKYNDTIVGEELNVNVPTNIDENINNKYTYMSITDEKYVIDMFNKLKNELLYDRKIIYEHLNEEYKKEKFETADDFNNFIDTNLEEYKNMTLSKYQIIEQENYIQYILVDKNNNYYILNENSIMNYNAILDTYTIDLPQFTEKYNKSNDADKAGMNLQKIADAINDKDYKYVYNRLDETFKQNNFKTLSDFENYCKSVFYTNNDIEFSNYQNSGALHMFDAKFTNKDNNTQSITKIFIIKLLEGTDFVMSFNVN